MRSDKLLLCALVLVALPLWGCKKQRKGAGSHAKALLLVRPFHVGTTDRRLLSRVRVSSHRIRTQMENAFRKSKEIRLLGAKSKDPAAYAVELGLNMRRVSVRRDRATRRILSARFRLSVGGRLVPLKTSKESIMIEEGTYLEFASQSPPRVSRIQQAYTYLWKRLAYSIRVFAQLRQKTKEPLLHILEKGEKVSQKHAAYLLGRKRVKEAVPGLIRLLKSKDEPLIRTAVGALVRLKDQRAAIPLIHVATRRDGSFLQQIVSALSEIGGEHAESYLYTLSSAHPNKHVRQSAKEGLQEIQRSKQGKIVQ